MNVYLLIGILSGILGIILITMIHFSRKSGMARQRKKKIKKTFELKKIEFNY